MINPRYILIPLAVLVCLAALAVIGLSPTPDLAIAPSQDASQLQPTAKQTEATLFFAGDIMLAREVNRRMAVARDYSLPFHQVMDRIRGADLSFANLESPFAEANVAPLDQLVFQADPKAIAGLVAAGFDVLSTANNHAFDQEAAGVTYTLNLLESNGLTAIGTGLDCHDGAIRQANDMKVGYLAYSYAAHNDGGTIRDPLVCDWNDRAQVTRDIAALKPHVDLLIVSAHMGEEYVREPRPQDVTSARAAIDAGADIIVGHHPHWIQKIEEYKSGHILYSLGNFVFDQMWSVDTRQGLAVEMLFKDKKLDRMSVLPLVIDNYCCPRWATDAEIKNILDKINLTSPSLPGNN